MEKIIDLGMHPYADTFISKDQLRKTEPVYPLQCFLDPKTGHVKVGYQTNSDERYNLYDYSYTSSNSEFSKKYWESYAVEVCKKLKLNKPINILEIGSNDGYLSHQFQKKGHNVLGVDSSNYMSKIANELGVETYCGMFDFSLSQTLKEQYGKKDLIIANNVFNHANDPLSFAHGAKNLLSKEGIFVFEVPYWYNTIVDKKFDQIYHEHVSYFTVKSSVELLKDVGLTVFDVEVVDYHGGSIRVYSKINPIEISPNISKLIQAEEKEGLFKVETYNKFMEEIKIKRASFLKKLYEISEQNIPIVAVGAAAKGNTFLNFYRLDNTIIDYVTDVSEHKKGKYTPLTRIPIEDDIKVFKKYEEVYVIILSWNISSMLKSKLLEINDKIKFIDL